VPDAVETPAATGAPTAQRVPAPAAAIAAASAVHTVVPPVVQPLAAAEPKGRDAAVVDAAPAAAAARPADARSPETVSVPLQSGASHPKPVAVHTVAPAFPAFARRQGSRVEASFSIAADGSVRDIRFAGHRDEAFEREAERALRQWRFDPASLPVDAGSARYQQAFVFTAPSRNAGERDGCILSTGSRICRDLDGGTMAKVYDAGF
jgi:TonB family protein